MSCLDGQVAECLGGNRPGCSEILVGHKLPPQGRTNHSLFSGGLEAATSRGGIACLFGCQAGSVLRPGALNRTRILQRNVWFRAS